MMGYPLFIDFHSVPEIDVKEYEKQREVTTFILEEDERQSGEVPKHIG